MVPQQPAGADTARGTLPARVARIALADAAIAGVLAGVIDLGVVMVRTPPGSGLAATALVVIGLAVAGAALTGAPLVLLVRLVGRHPTLRAIGQRVARPGRDRVMALVEVAAALAVLVVLWAAAFAVARFAFDRYNSGAGAALLIATVVLGALVGAALLASALAPPLAARLGAARWMVRATSGRAPLVVVGTVVAALLLLGDRVLRTRFYSWDPVPAYLYATATAAIVAAALARPSERLGRRAAAVAAALLVLVVGALFTVGAARPARLAVVNGAVISKGALRSLHRATDRDGDGYGRLFGGGDCDDGDRRVHPAAREIAGNHRDDNCIGGDGAAADAGRPAARAAPGAPTSNVLLITIDTVRADHTSLYGYPRPTTPALVELASRGVRFDRAETASPTTRRALPSILFGRYPATLPFDPKTPTQLLAHSLPTLATVLTGAGYRTQALFGVGGVLDDNALVGFAATEGLSPHGRGYKRPHNAVEVTDRALAWIRAAGPGPWFLWIHYFDPHHPYGTPPGAPHFGDERIDHYDAEIANADAQIGRLVAGLDGARPTLVAVTADHGESFGERGAYFHGKSLHEEQTRVPLVIAAVGGPAAGPGRIETTPVSLIDVAPTLLELAGVAVPADMHGQSLAPAVRGSGPVRARPILMDLALDRYVSRRMLAVVDGDHKLIWDLDAGAMTAFDLRRDPDESEDLFATPIGAVLRATLGATVDRELAAAR